MGGGYLAEGHRLRVVKIAGIAAITRNRRDRKGKTFLPQRTQRSEGTEPYAILGGLGMNRAGGARSGDRA
jgi:hypothetical protein